MSPSSSSSSGSDRDDALDEDMEALRRACLITGRNPTDVDVSDTDSDNEDSGADDIDLLRRLQERFSLPSAVDSSPIAKPLNTRPPPDSDEEDDLETLHAIQRRFAQYENDAIKKKAETCLEETGMAVAEVTSGREIPDVLSKYVKCMTQSEKSPDSGTTELHQAADETCNISGKALMHSHFPKSALNFVDALKKNRSCQKFIRRKLIEIQAKIEENKELRERVKCLMDFQVACEKNVGRMFCQQKDPHIRLVSMQKSSTAKTPKTSSKKVPASCFGPAENSHVSRYKMVMKRFPVSLHEQRWSNIEKENLAKGLKQQYQEMLILSSMNFESDCDIGIGSNSMPVLSSSDREVTPEKIRSFLPLVNWDRLASMYLTGRSGAECESRWLNCEDPMISHNPWTILEDKKLLYIVQERGVYNWIDIAVTLGTHRTPFQCLARYQRSLNPHILNKDWTKEEDAKLRAAVENFGHGNWQIIASNLEGRSGVQCSNRWRKSLHPDRKKVGRWSVDEDKRLKVAAMLFGAKNWNKIAHFAPGRTQVQCRERWLNCLDPSLNLEPWTEEEDTKLLAAITEHGYSWSKVATCVPPRTDNQCRRRWKILLPHEVPLLRAAKTMRRTVLISNFVDRESERPSIGPNDFSPLVLPPAAEDGNIKRTRKNRSRKSRAESRSSLEENSTADCIVNSSSDIAPADLSLVPGVNSTTAESRSRKRATKKTRNNQPKKSRAKSRISLEENLTADAIVNSSSEIAPGTLSLVPGVKSTFSRSIKRTRKKTSRISLEKTATSGAIVNSSSEIAPGALSLVPGVKSTFGRSIKRTRKKTSSDNLPKKSEAQFRSPLDENLTADGMVNPSSDIVAANLSLEPCVNSTTTESRSMKRTRKKTSRYDLPKLDKILAVNSMTNSLESAPAGLSLVPIANSSTDVSGSMKRARKKSSRDEPKEKTQRASCDSPQQLQPDKSNGKTRLHKENIVADSVVNYHATENAPSDNPNEAGLQSSAVESRSRKRTRDKKSREGAGASNQQETSCNDSRLVCPKKPRAKRKTSPTECLMTDNIMKDDENLSKEKRRRSERLISKRARAIFNPSAEGVKVLQPHLDHTLVNIMGSRAPISDGTSNTVDVSHSNTRNDIGCSDSSKTAGVDELLPDSTSLNEAKRKQESEVVPKGAENSSENSGIQNTARKLLKLGHEMDENIQSGEHFESLPHLDRSASKVVDRSSSEHGIKSAEAFSFEESCFTGKTEAATLANVGNLISDSSETLQSQETSQMVLKTVLA